MTFRAYGTLFLGWHFFYKHFAPMGLSRLDLYIHFQKSVLKGWLRIGHQFIDGIECQVFQTSPARDDWIPLSAHNFHSSLTGLWRLWLHIDPRNKFLGYFHQPLWGKIVAISLRTNLSVNQQTQICRNDKSSWSPPLQKDWFLAINLRRRFIIVKRMHQTSKCS